MGLRENLQNEPVRDLNLRPAITAKPEILVREAVELMRGKRLGCLILVDDDQKPVGVFTEGMLRHLLAQNSRVVDDSVEQHMATQFPWVTPDDPVITVLEAMQIKNHRFVVVVDGDGKVKALTGQKGLMEYIADYFPEQVLTQRGGAKAPISEREGA